MGGPLRYPDVAVFWVQCEQSVLDDRCNRRVDKMIELGMINELEQFHKVSKSFIGNKLAARTHITVGSR
jgi:tRNA A37 N6-isopentenylltransferase MiaA